RTGAPRQPPRPLSVAPEPAPWELAPAPPVQRLQSLESPPNSGDLSSRRHFDTARGWSRLPPATGALAPVPVPRLKPPLQAEACSTRKLELGPEHELDPARRACADGALVDDARNPSETAADRRRIAG